MHMYSNRLPLPDLWDLLKDDQSPRIYNPNGATCCWLGYHSIINITPPFKGGPFGQHQACLGSAQTSHETKAWSTHFQPAHLCQHIGALQLPSAPYHECSVTRSLCVSTYHRTLIFIQLWLSHRIMVYSISRLNRPVNNF
jgi:hypothetical protein